MQSTWVLVSSVQALKQVFFQFVELTFTDVTIFWSVDEIAKKYIGCWTQSDTFLNGLHKMFTAL